jgi:hypothetical protein
MKRTEVRDILYEELSNLLVPVGFKLSRKEEGFSRKIDLGKQFIGIALWSYAPLFQFSLAAGVRLDVVERFIHRFTGAPPEYALRGYTTVVRMEYFSGKDDHKIDVTNESEIRSSVAGIRHIIQKMVSFLDEHQTIESLDHAMNVLHAGVMHQPWLGIYSLVLAHMTGNVQFEQIVKKHSADLALCTPEERAKFVEVVEYLHKIKNSQV